ncbi:GNAT family N-acetyltransferase [Evansella halocellulosilytica]|uniref:GNAT family N-acetyltransferase n=1 Tax=Evansella halocellulosilytica TaxID=2011013 RepID=UPI000BB86392|nr:GNAT family N-acetyltransferase [Evansella halocellulosilytica]
MEQKIDFQFIDDVSRISEVVAFQETIWNSVTSLHQLIASVNNGGHVIGAYDKNNLVGFCYGFPGFRNNRNVLVSHMMGVYPAYRNQGIGKSLKLYQKEWAYKYGYEKVIWTYDPLEARNGYLNIAKLGGYVQHYYPSYYGENMEDHLNHGMPTDRFLVELDLTTAPLKRQDYSDLGAIHLVDCKVKNSIIYPVKNKHQIEQMYYKIAVPTNIQEIKKTDIEVALKWRYTLRDAFIELFNEGYVVVDMLQGQHTKGIHYYIVKASKRESEKRH